MTELPTIEEAGAAPTATDPEDAKADRPASSHNLISVCWLVAVAAAFAVPCCVPQRSPCLTGNALSQEISCD